MIIIPMAGLSSRFSKHGYIKPKYMLEAQGKTLLEHSVNTFKTYFKNTKFLFILNEVFDSYNFVLQIIKKIGIIEYEIISLKNPTRGQAETVFLGLQKVYNKNEITIFNIDTLRLNFRFPKSYRKFDGFIDVFPGSGSNWSFIKTENDKSKLIIQTSEKIPISNLCCSGIYHFNNYIDFIDAYNHFLSVPKQYWTKGEIYVAPLYNYLISKGKYFFYTQAKKNEMFFFGDPQQYKNFCREKIY